MTVLQLVDRERSRVGRLIAVAGTAAALAVVALVLTLGVMSLGGARWIGLPRLAPFVVWLVVALVLAAGTWWTARLLRRDASRAGLALAVEQEQSLRSGMLRGALEVADSGALGRRAAEQVAARLARANTRSLAPALQRRALVRVGVTVLATTVAALVLVSRSSAAPDGWRAIAHPVRAWNGTLLPRIELLNAPKTVLRGERLALIIAAPQRREITLSQRSKGAAWRSTLLQVNAAGQAELSLGAADADLTLVATDGRGASDTAVVRVVDRPFIGDVAVRALFPAYLGRAEETLPTGEPARLPQGTVLSIDGQSSTELVRVVLARDGDTLRLQPNGRRFSGRLTPTQTGRYLWTASGAGGDIADVPPPLELEIVPDSAPRIEIIAPARDTIVTPTDSITLSVLAADDHGLGMVALRTWKKSQHGESSLEAMHPLPAEASTQWTGDALLELARFSLTPGDEVHVVAVGIDGSPWKQRGESRELILRVPGMREQREAARATGDSAVARAEAAARAEKSLAQRTAEASKKQNRGQEKSNEAGQAKSSMSYEQAEQARALAKEQRELAERVKQLQELAKTLEKQLRQSGALDSGLSARLREAQKLLQEALTPELAEQLRKLEEAAQKLSGDDARRAMSDLAQQQQRLREQLEKSVEMLKRAALEGSMQTLKDEAKDLAKKERALADSMDRAKDAKQKRDANQEARDLAKESKELQKELEELQKRLQQENAQTGAQHVNQAQRKAKESTDAMERAAQSNPEQGQKQPQNGQQQNGQPQPGDPKQQQPRGERPDSSQQQPGKPQAGQQQQGEKKAGEQQTGQQQAGQKQAGQQQSGQQQSGQQQQNGEKNGEKNAARQAAEAMDKAAEQLAEAREKQINEWKKELTSELDQSIQEMLQLARQQDGLEQQARQGADKNQLQPQQSALQQGVDKAAQRLGDAGQKSSLLSQRSQRSVGDAKKKVEQATRELSDARSSNQAAGSMREASEALNQAAASLVRDRERAQNAQSASGFAEMLEQLQQMAKQQGSLNAQSLELMPRPGSQLDQQGRENARQLAKQQRGVAENLDNASDLDRTGKADELAKEARQIAQALEQGQVDQSVIERQQRLFRRMLDAGRTLEQDERDDTGKREAKAWTGTEVLTPQGSVNSKAASRFPAPVWNDLRGLTPEERRMVLEYFKRINADRP